MKLLSHPLPAIFLAGFTALFAGPRAVSAQIGENMPWQAAVKTDLAVDFGNTGFHGRWQYQRCDCGDLLIKLEQVAPDGVLSGELIMVRSKLLLARGFDKQGDDVAPLIQAPSLMLQLAYGLLNRSQPKGPAAVGDSQKWNIREATTNFSLNTGVATGIFAAPWQIKGKGWETEAGHRRFELTFHFANPSPGHPDKRDSIKLSGDLDYLQEAFPYTDDTPFTGWRMQWLSRHKPESEPVPEGATLGQLRAQAKTH